MGQSSNDVFPSAVHLAALDDGDQRAAAGARRSSRRPSPPRPSEFHDIVKAGRTHLMDAVPVTLGPGVLRLRRADPARRASASRNALPQVAQIPLGGTATGTGLNTHPEFAARVRARLTEASRASRSARPRIPSRPRATATRWSSCRAR